MSTRGDGSPVRVVHVMWRLSRGGGVPIVVRNVATHVDPAQVELHVVTLRPAADEDGLDELGAGVEIHPLGVAGSVRPWHRVVVMLRVAWLLVRLRPGLVQTHTGTAWMSLLGRLVRPQTPFVLEVHDAPGHGRHSAATDRFEGVLARRLGFRPLCHSTSVRSDVARDWRVPLADVELFPLGIDTSAFSAFSTTGAAWRAEHGLDPERPVILYVARLVPSKNVALLIDVADRLRAQAADLHAQVVVVAGGPEQETLQREIERRGLSDDVRLIGPLYGAQLADAYGAGDVFCSTSIYEGFGLAIVEAMAAGLPVVATAVGGVTDLVVEGETGVLVPEGDAAALADRLAGLLRDPARAAAMGAAGQARARQRFDVATMGREFQAMYLRLALRRRR